MKHEQIIEEVGNYFPNNKVYIDNLGCIGIIYFTGNFLANEKISLEMWKRVKDKNLIVGTINENAKRHLTTAIVKKFIEDHTSNKSEKIFIVTPLVEENYEARIIHPLRFMGIPTGMKK